MRESHVWTLHEGSAPCLEANAPRRSTATPDDGAYCVFWLDLSGRIALGDVQELQDEAGDAVQAFLRGDPVELHDVMAAQRPGLGRDPGGRRLGAPRVAALPVITALGVGGIPSGAERRPSQPRGGGR